jgi:tetratricopeptide (TPR) repeat protein
LRAGRIEIDALSGLAQLQGVEGVWTEAILLYKRALDLVARESLEDKDRDRYEARLTLGLANAYREAGNLEEAGEWYKRGLAKARRLDEDSQSLEIGEG